jgi:hypothetical protein
LIPGVEVTARNVNTGIVTTGVTNEAGAYQFASLQPGTYTVSAALPGFQTATFNNVVLGTGVQVRYNFTLQVGSVTTAVEVVAEANTLLATTAASVGNVLPERDVLSLPVASRNVLDFVTTAVGGVGVAGGFGGATAFAGVETGQVNTTRDGLVTNDGRYNNSVYSAVFTSPDLVEEVRVSVTSIDAALGRGNAQVQMRTRAGTNEFHGALFYTNNNSALDAVPWFDNLVGAEKAFRNRNQYGGRIGGPIVRNKAFFFVLIDQQRTMLKQDVLTTVLTGPARQGIFRFLTQNATGANGGASRRNGNALAIAPSVDLAGNTLTSHNGTPLFLNQINLFSDVNDPNRTRIDPTWVATQMLPRMPLPNDWTTGDGLNTAGFRWLRRHEGEDGATGQSSDTNRDHLTVRLDYQLNADHKFTYTMSREENWGVTGQTGLPAVPDGYFGDVVRVPDFYTANWTATLSSSLLNEFRFGMKRDTWQGTSPYDKGCCYGGRGENDLADSAAEARASMPQIDGYMLQVGGGTGFPNYAPFGVASPRASVSPFYQWADTINWTMGSHSFQGGVEFNFASSDQANHGGQGTTRPRASIGIGVVPVPGITTTNFRGLNSNDITTANNLLASLAGTVASLQQQYFINDPSQTDWTSYRETFLFRRDIHQNDWAAFWKDNWKVTPNFTLNLGLRYDKYGTPYDTYGLGGRFTGGQSALFGISGTDFNAMWNPFATGGQLTTTEFVGKHSPNPDKLIWGNDWNNLAPSVGFSWNLPFERDTVLRGGYGINYAGNTNFLSYSGTIGNLPGQTLNVDYQIPTYMDLARVVTAGLVPLPTGGTRPFEAVPLTNRSAGITGYADDRVIPYIQSFNLGIQTQLTPTVTLDVGYVGNKSTKLFSSTQLNESNIFENGILDAFLVTRAGGNAPLFDQILMGLNVPGAGVVNGTTLTGSQALRRYSSTNAFIANGQVGSLANFINTTSALAGSPGGLLRRVGLPENYIVVNPQFGSVSLAGNNDNANYHSLQTVINQRYSNGLSGQFSHTWSKAMGSTDSRNPRSLADKGLQGSDRTHVFKANGTVELPFGPNRPFLANAPGFVHRIVEGWQFSGIFVQASGANLSFGGTGNTMGSRIGSSPNLVGALPKDLGKVVVGDNGVITYFEGLSVRPAPLPNFGGDPTLPGRFTNQVVVDSAGNIVLASAEPGTFGNVGGNVGNLKGPSTLSLDMAVTKNIQIREGMSFTLRVDAINVLNKPQWGQPETGINSANFGRIDDATGSRTITVNARIDF